MGFYFDGRQSQAADFASLSRIIRRMAHRFGQASDKEIDDLKAQLQTAISEAFDDPLLRVNWDQLAVQLAQEFNRVRDSAYNPLEGA